MWFSLYSACLRLNRGFFVIWAWQLLLVWKKFLDIISSDAAFCSSISSTIAVPFSSSSVSLKRHDTRDHQLTLCLYTLAFLLQFAIYKRYFKLCGLLKMSTFQRAPDGQLLGSCASCNHGNIIWSLRCSPSQVWGLVLTDKCRQPQGNVLISAERGLSPSNGFSVQYTAQTKLL